MRRWIALGVLTLAACAEESSQHESFETHSSMVCPSGTSIKDRQPPFSVLVDKLKDDGSQPQWLHTMTHEEDPGSAANRLTTWLSGTVAPTCDAPRIRWKGSLFGRQEYLARPNAPNGLCWGHTTYFFDIEIEESGADCSQLRARLADMVLNRIVKSLRSETGR
jgi:hypothetical protein